LSGAQYRKRKARKLQIEQELAGSLDKFFAVETPHLQKKQKILFTDDETGSSAVETSKKIEQGNETEETVAGSSNEQ
jgi:hypothetical protein